MRVLVLTIVLVFIAALAALTIRDFAHHGVTPVGLLAVFVLVLFTTGIVGALRQPPNR